MDETEDIFLVGQTVINTDDTSVHNGRAGIVLGYSFTGRKVKVMVNGKSQAVLFSPKSLRWTGHHRASEVKVTRVRTPTEPVCSL